MESFTNLLSDAFSETTVPSFEDEDLDFHRLDCNNQSQEDEGEPLTKNEGARVQEAASDTAQVVSEDAEDLLLTAGIHFKEHSDDGIDEKKPEAVGPISIHRTPISYTPLEGEYKDRDSFLRDCKEDCEEYGGKLKSLFSLSGTRGRSSSEEDSVGVTENLLPLEGHADLCICNKERAEAENNEEVSCFGQEPEQGHVVMTEVATVEEVEQESDEEDSSSDSERIHSEDHFFTGNLAEEEFGGTERGVPAEDDPTSPCISVQNLQDLLAEIDGEESVKDINDFSGEEHQEAGENIAEYPSELSFFEYVEDDEKHEINNQLKAVLFTVDCCSNAQHDSTVESAGMEEVWTGSATTSSTKDDENDMTIEQEQRQSENVIIQNKDQQNPETKNQAADVGLYRVSSTMPSNYGPYYLSNSENNLPGYSRWDLEEVGTCYTLQDVEQKDTKDTESCPESVRQCPVMEIYDSSEVQSEGYRVMAASSQRFPVSESLLSCQTQTSMVPGLSGPVQNNWEPMKERIQAFYKYYDDDEEEEEEENERRVKVQFSAHPLSRVIHYKGESSDSESVSSSTDRAEDPSADDTFDGGHKSVTAGEHAQRPLIAERRLRETHAEQHKCGRVLMLMLKTTLYTVMGILLFWIFLFPDCLSHIFDN